MLQAQPRITVRSCAYSRPAMPVIPQVTRRSRRVPPSQAWILESCPADALRLVLSFCNSATLVRTRRCNSTLRDSIHEFATHWIREHCRIAARSSNTLACVHFLEAESTLTTMPASGGRYWRWAPVQTAVLAPRANFAQALEYLMNTIGFTKVDVQREKGRTNSRCTSILVQGALVALDLTGNGVRVDVGLIEEQKAGVLLVTIVVRPDVLLTLSADIEHLFMTRRPRNQGHCWRSGVVVFGKALFSAA